MSGQESLKQRQSGIELLKIIAMFIIVIGHCVQIIHESDVFLLNEVYLVLCKP